MQNWILSFMPRALFVCLALLSGCATTELFENKVRSRARFDLGCEEVSLTELGGGVYGVQGCGYKATYVLMPTAEGGCSVGAGIPKRHVEQHCAAVLNSEKR